MVLPISAIVRHCIHHQQYRLRVAQEDLFSKLLGLSFQRSGLSPSVYPWRRR